jgi:hypothetical protein
VQISSLNLPILQLVSDTYTPEELSRCSLWALASFSGPRHIYNGVRDRAMLLLSAATAFRGDSARQLLFSDLFCARVPVDDLGLGTTVPVSVYQVLISIWLICVTGACDAS